MQLALCRYTIIMGAAYPYEPKLETIQSANFIAQAIADAGYIKVQISTGVTDALVSLWDKAIAYSDTSLLNIRDTEQTLETSLIWLVLHELYHFELGHFELLGWDEITETADADSFGLVSRDENQSSPIPELIDIDYQLLERCLELQADHEAIDIFLNECSIDDTEELRLRIAAISAMMVLIDVEDMKRNSKQTSHPKAATRIFQLLAHLCEVPLIPAQARAMADDKPIDHDAIPSEDEQQAFVKEVAIPAFYDAIELAKAAHAGHIINELGDLPAFFDDVFLAKTNSGEGVAQFKTQGAKEWCQLKPINERVLAVQRERNLI